MVKKSLFARTATSVRRRATSDGDGNSIHNRILLGLPSKEYKLLFDKLTLIELALHDVLQEAGQPIKYAYFLNTAMASILNLMTDGKSVEVGLTGKEGFVGIPLIAGFRTSPTLINTQAKGTAFRVDADALRKVLLESPELVRALVRYSQEATMQVTQIAACNGLHEIDQRLARWLLMCQDRIGGDLLPLTQDFLAQMLGTRRASVSVSAAILQRAGLIKYSRGHVTVLDRPGLENACCECYGVIKQHLKNWERESS